MCRIVHGVPGDPVRIDGGSVERHAEEPVVGRRFGELVTQRAGLMVNSVKSRFDINLPRLN